MIRVATFFIAVTLIALGVVWFADRPGDVAVTWLGYRIETSVMVAGVALLALVLAAIFLWSLLSRLFRSPHHVSRFLGGRRSARGQRAITRGLIAIGAGDTKLALKSAEEASRLAADEPLTLLLSAQAAQLAGDRAQAERAFRAMTGREDTKLLGLRGLYIEAQRRADAEAAALYAEEAAKASPALGWAAQAALDARTAAGDWIGALDVLEHMRRGLDREDYRRQRAVLLTAAALATEDRDDAQRLAREAVGLAPSLVPAAVIAGRGLAEAGEARKATRILRDAWAENPHPDIAEAYATVRSGVSARERLKRLQALVEKYPGDVEGALAVASAALEAHDFETTRAALAPYAAQPTRRVANLMSELEEQQHGDRGRARQWMARAVHAAPDPAWTADGVVSDKWLPVSPVTGKLDAFVWRVPLDEIGVERPLIEGDLLAPPPPPPAAPPPPEPADARSERQPKPKTARKDQPRAEPIIPLLHAPDDPGLEPPSGSDPLAEPAQPPSPFERLRQLFRA